MVAVTDHKQNHIIKELFQAVIADIIILLVFRFAPFIAHAGDAGVYDSQDHIRTERKYRAGKRRRGSEKVACTLLFPMELMQKVKRMKP